MESFRNSILESDSIMYQHLQSSIIFPLLPFLPWAMVPRIVIIWRSSQGSRAAFRAAGTEGAARGGSEGRPRFVLLILQPPSTNSSKYWVMLQGVTRSEKQAASRLAWRLCKHKRVMCGRADDYFRESAEQNAKERLLPSAAIVHTEVLFLNTGPI